MATIVHGFDWPDRFVTGTVGEPGARTFFLQARAGRELVSVSLEKEQSQALAERIDEILDELMAEGQNPFSVPTSTPPELVDNDPLETPFDEQFRTGVLSLGWDPRTAQVVIEAFPLADIDPEELQQAEPEETIEIEPTEALVVRIPVGAARAFAKRTREVVGAGRPICPLCGLPMDPEGHVCELPDGFR